ncbi:MAG TPA: hypothetical protein EYQ74_10185 [Planctomycetes bacterium]|nr:hypothetical protein [Planctomycetota bacterium]HIK59194.1 hypothetical protein [Planctomycetota bacterium]
MNRQSIRDAMIESLSGVTTRHASESADVDHGTDRLELLPQAVREHLIENEALHQEWRQLLRQARAIRTLSRVPVPSDLDGRVVASLQAGYRQGRVAEQVQTLPAERAPRELDLLVRRLANQPFTEASDDRGDLKAPTTLDRLVAVRVNAERSARRPNGLPRASRLMVAAALLVATSLGLVRLLGERDATNGTEGLEVASFSFRMIRIEDPALADPDLLNLLGGMSGGMLDGREGSR